MIKKGDMYAVLIILMGVVLTQLQPQTSFTLGLGLGTMLMACVWLGLRIYKDNKKRSGNFRVCYSFKSFMKKISGTIFFFKANSLI